MGWCLVLLGAGVGCSAEPPAGAATSPIVGPATAPEPVVAPEPTPDAAVLATRADGLRFLGAAEPLLPHTDMEPVFVLRVVDERGASAAAAFDPALDGARVLAARFADAAVLTLGADHVLRAHQRGGVSVLDQRAYGPLSVVGRQVAYARGEMGSLEIAVVDLDRGAPRALTQGMAPAWSPALTEDGAAVVFVSGASGRPRLHRVTLAGALEPLPELARFPTAPTPPRFEAGLYVFEDHLGTAWVDVDQGRIVREEAR